VSPNHDRGEKASFAIGVLVTGVVEADAREVVDATNRLIPQRLGSEQVELRGHAWQESLGQLRLDFTVRDLAVDDVRDGPTYRRVILDPVVDAVRVVCRALGLDNAEVVATRGKLLVPTRQLYPTSSLVDDSSQPGLYEVNVDVRGLEHGSDATAKRVLDTLRESVQIERADASWAPDTGTLSVRVLRTDRGAALAQDEALLQLERAIDSAVPDSGDFKMSVLAVREVSRLEG
jgi:hypothetical protein